MCSINLKLHLHARNYFSSLFCILKVSAISEVIGRIQMRNVVSGMICIHKGEELVMKNKREFLHSATRDRCSLLKYLIKLTLTYLFFSELNFSF